MCRLNARHQDVLWLISKGLTNAEIGRHLGLSERTVKDYVGRLLLVPEASNRTELIGRMLPDLRLQPERSDRTEPSCNGSRSIAPIEADFVTLAARSVRAVSPFSIISKRSSPSRVRFRRSRWSHP
jgi:DNA-binding CsgD family transcriptional regulator